MLRVAARRGEWSWDGCGAAKSSVLSQKNLSWVTGNAMLGLSWKPQGYSVSPPSFEGGPRQADGRIVHDRSQATLEAQKRHGTRSPSKFLEGTNPAHILASDFQPPELRENEFVML